MTPNNEVRAKAKLFALYLGQKVFCKKHWNHTKILFTSWLEQAIYDDAYLLLRPIESLTDEQLLEIAVLRGYRKSHLTEILVDKGREYKEVINEVRKYLSTYEYSEVRLCIIDYLRLNNFATPIIYLDDNHKPVTASVSELVEWGWVKLTTNN